MESFEVTVDDITYNITQEEDGTFLVFKDGVRMCDLFPDHDDSGLIWRSSDLISDEMACNIGDAIERYDM